MGTKRLLRTSLAKVAHAPGDVVHRQQVRRHRTGLAPLDPVGTRLAAEMERVGVTATSLDELAFASTAAMLEEAARQLAAMEHVRPAASIDRTAPEAPQVVKVTDLPDIARWGEEPALLAIVERYLGRTPTFQGVHLRRDFANPRPVTTELWHKDLEDRRMLKAIIYLEDVDDAVGPFEYIPRSTMTPAAALRVHLNTTRSDAMGIDDATMEAIVPRDRWQRCNGPANSVVLMDPVGVFHHGKPRTRDRAALFFVYTSDRPLRPELCRQYRDDTFARPDV